MRLDLATDIKTRPSAPDKDARLTNAYVEVKNGQTVVRKRTGIDNAATVLAGQAQGGIGTTINGIQVAVVANGDTLSIGEALDSIPSSEELLTSIAAYNSSRGVSALNWFLQLESCALVDLPADDDRGTSVYAGPAETPYSVPAITVEYVTIADTNCGLYRKKITKTYSLRTVPNTYRWAGTFVAYPGGGTDVSPTFTDYIAGYGATSADSINDFMANALAACPTSGTYYANPSNPLVAWTNPTFITAVGPYQYQGIYGDSALGGVVYLYAATDAASTQLTVYYLDVHELWEYEIV